MDSVDQRKKKVIGVLATILEDHYQIKEPINASLVQDDENGHYLIFLQGWQAMRHIYGVSIHVEVKPDGKVWIHRDSSSVVIVDRLEKAGIPTKQMVISWHPPVARPHTEFALG
ncbi:MAG: element excision factor XisI family protein [Bacteroidota bacterium]